MCISVVDDGVGMVETHGHRGAGLVGMHDRIRAIGGELEVTSSPGHGTRVMGTVPL